MSAGTNWFEDKDIDINIEIHVPENGFVEVTKDGDIFVGIEDGGRMRQFDELVAKLVEWGIPLLILVFVLIAMKVFNL